MRKKLPTEVFFMGLCEQAQKFEKNKTAFKTVPFFNNY